MEKTELMLIAEVIDEDGDTDYIGHIFPDPITEEDARRNIIHIHARGKKRVKSIVPYDPEIHQ